MKIAVIAYHSSPLGEPGAGDAGGMTVYVTELARALAKKGVHTDIYTRSTGGHERVTQLSPGVRVISIEAGPARPVAKETLPRYIDAFTAGVRTFAAAQRAAYSVVHSHYWQAGLAGADLAAGWRVPLVHSHHTLGLVKNRYLPAGDVPEPEERLLGEKQVMESADALVASTEEEHGQLACLYGVSHDRLMTVHPGVDHGMFQPGDRRVAREELGLEPDRPLVLFVGRVQPLKGIDLAIRSLAEISGRGIDADLIVVGGASGARGDHEVERLRDLAEAAGVGPRVVFAGPLPRPRLPSYYRAANAVVVCSHSESFGFAALEAHACGTPVVATAVGGLAHIVSDGRTGFLVRSRDPEAFAQKLEPLLVDDELNERFSIEAARSAHRFSWSHTADALLDLYGCLVGEHPELCTC